MSSGLFCRAGGDDRLPHRETIHAPMSARGLPNEGRTVVSGGLSRKDFLARTAVLGGALAVPAVAQAGSRRVSIVGAAGKPSTLNILYATVEADADAIKLVLPDLQKELGIKVNLTTMPYATLQPKVFSELAAKSSHYDIILHDVSWMSAITQKVQPLTGYMINKKLTSKDLALGDFIEKVFYDTVVWNRKKAHLHFPNPGAANVAAIKAKGFDVLGLPIQSNVLTMSYRKDLFTDPTEMANYKQQTGNELRVPVTWDEFAAVAKFFTRPDKRLWGTTLMAGAGDWATDDFKTFLAAFGGDGHLVDDKFNLSFAGPAGVEALTFYRKLIHEDKVTPPGTTAASWDTVTQSFGSGLTAMSMNYHQETLAKNVKGSIGYALVPKQKSQGPHFGTWMLSVNQYGKYPTWAYQAIVWLTAAAQQKRMLKTQLHPTRKSAYVAAKTDPTTKAFGNFYDVLGKSLAVGVGRPRVTNYGDVDQAIWIAVNDAANGADPASSLQKQGDKVRSLLQKAGYSAK
jgi:multiple sugar transport system substrate-binding protein